MKHIDVITLTENVNEVIRLANENGAIECYVGNNSGDHNSQQIHIKSSDDKHQAVYKELLRHLNTSSTSIIEIRSAEQELSDNHKNTKHLDSKDQLSTSNDSDISKLVDASLYLIVSLSICVLLFILFQVFDAIS